MRRTLYLEALYGLVCAIGVLGIVVAVLPDGLAFVGKYIHRDHVGRGICTTVFAAVIFWLLGQIYYLQDLKLEDDMVVGLRGIVSPTQFAFPRRQWFFVWFGKALFWLFLALSLAVVVYYYLVIGHPSG